MKKTKISLLTTLLFTASLSSVLAVGPNVENKRMDIAAEETQQQNQQGNGAMAGQQNQGDTVVGQQDQVMQRQQQSMKGIVSRIQLRYEEHLARYEQFMNKLESRRGKIESGQDTTELDKQMRFARTELATTRNNVAELKLAVENADYTQTSTQLRSGFRSELTGTKNQFGQLHQQMIKVVKELAKLSN